jgi:hypothetical protein
LSGTGAVRSVLLDVVLDQGTGGPAVDRDEDSSGRGRGGTLEADFAGRALTPALAYDEVSSVGKVYAVAVAGGRVLNGARGLVVLVVVLAGSEALAAELKVRDIGSGCGVGRAGDSGETEDKRAKSNHFEESWFVVNTVDWQEKRMEVKDACVDEMGSLVVSLFFPPSPSYMYNRTVKRL